MWLRFLYSGLFQGYAFYAFLNKILTDFEIALLEGLSPGFPTNSTSLNENTNNINPVVITSWFAIHIKVRSAHISCFQFKRATFYQHDKLK